jgi:type IV secretory pathway VirB4 component
MLRLGRIVRDHQEAGSVSSLISIWGFVDDETFITKAGHVGIAYRVAGADYECLDQSQRREVVHRLEAALRLLDDTCRVYQYLCKRRIQPVPTPVTHRPLVEEAVRRHIEHVNARRQDLYEIDLYLVLLYEACREVAAPDWRRFVDTLVALFASGCQRRPPLMSWRLT